MGAFTLVQFRSTTVPTACHHHQLFLLHILIMSLSSCKCRITYWHGWDITDCSWRNSQRAVQAHWCVLNGIILFLLQIPDRWSLTTVGDWPVHTMQLVGYELNWFLYGILLVQVCKLNRSVQYNILIHGLDRTTRQLQSNIQERLMEVEMSCIWRISHRDNPSHPMQSWLVSWASFELGWSCSFQ